MQTDTDTTTPRDARDPLILAIDVGTSSTRVLVYDAGGRRIEGWEIHRPYAVTTTADGGVTVDPQFLFELTVACLDDVLPRIAAAGRQVAAVACDAFWHSLLGLDAGGKPRTPILTWADTRSGQGALELRHELDEKEVHQRTGAGLHSSYWPAKLRWLSHSDPDTYRSVRHWVSFAEYLYLQLFGQLRVSLSMASGTGLFVQNACVWDQPLLDHLDISPDTLSPLHDFSDPMHDLGNRYARRWPGLDRVPWYLALGDGACNNIGSGGYSDQWAVVMVGTSGALRVVREAPRIDIPAGLWTYRVDRRRFVQGGALSAGGNVFAWLMQTLDIADPLACEREAAGLPPDGHGLTVLPFLAGERSPDWNPSAQAAIVGATLNTSRAQIVRATLEAMTYRFGLVYDIMRRSVASSSGIIGSGAGLIHSPVWMQIMTDVLARPLTASAVTEASSRGAALLVLESMGALHSIGDAPVPLGARFEPDPEHTSIYRAAMKRQQDLYARLAR